MLSSDLASRLAGKQWAVVETFKSESVSGDEGDLFPVISITQIHVRRYRVQFWIVGAIAVRAA